MSHSKTANPPAETNIPVQQQLTLKSATSLLENQIDMSLVAAKIPGELSRYRTALSTAYLSKDKPAALDRFPELQPVYAFEEATQVFITHNRHRITHDISTKLMLAVRNKALDELARSGKLPGKPNLSAIVPQQG